MPHETVGWIDTAPSLQGSHVGDQIISGVHRSLSETSAIGKDYNRWVPSGIVQGYLWCAGSELVAPIPTGVFQVSRLAWCLVCTISF